ncbi:MAG: hypothetical protein K8Q91_02805 [Candidatus Vogelbacteria bacterium]|nr:hypothetical protein [Candidatus Vogelbacteria bacterium]
MNKFKFFGVLFLIAVLVGGGFYYYQTNFSKSDVTITDWKTYTNEKYKFEVSYPEDWTLRDGSMTYTNGNRDSKGVGLDGPVRYDFPGYEKIGVRYSLSIGFKDFYNKEDVVTNYSGFIKLKEDGEQAPQPVTIANLKDDKDYQTAQKIIASAHLK